MSQIYDLITEDAARTEAKADGTTWYTLDPSIVYPWTLARIAEALAAVAAPGGDLSAASVGATIRDLYLAKAVALSAEAWALAATPYDQVPEADRPIRAEALHIVQRWALEQHHAAIGYKNRSIYVVNRPDWRE